MLDNEIRHLPVVEDGVVVGVISARDALQALADEVRESPGLGPGAPA
jgi:CBS domain-containing protein